ncbi:MAG: glutamate racemase [Arenicella sp.]|jgi:glutamate racemase
MARIAIFDSGVGGLSIYSEVSRRLPGHEFVFVSDNLCYPYGNKAEDWLIARVQQLSQRVVDRCSPDVFVVACNTASTIVLPALRETLPIPVVGVVPAIKPGSKLSKTKHLGLLATPGTIARAYTNDLINEFAAECTVSKVGSSKLVELAEQKLRGKKIDLGILEDEIEPLLKDKEIDVLVLACTHFPLLNNEIESIFKVNNHSLELVDSAKGIANRVSSLIDDMHPGALATSNLTAKNQAFFTKEIGTQNFLINQLEKIGLAYQGEL